MTTSDTVLTNRPTMGGMTIRIVPIEPPWFEEKAQVQSCTWRELNQGHIPQGIVDAINWEIQVVNSTMQVLNDGKVRVDKESFNADIVALSKAISAKDDAKMAEEFQRVIPVFKQLGESVNEVIK